MLRKKRKTEKERLARRGSEQRCLLVMLTIFSLDLHAAISSLIQPVCPFVSGNSLDVFI
nr:MAG TPA: hypothetical protein [Caudoviricetes sp.]